MGSDKRIIHAVAAGWSGQMLLLLGQFVQMPFFFKYLPKEDLGIWFLLGASGVFVALLDFGFTYTLSRYVAFAKAKSGSSPDSVLSDESIQEIADLLKSARLIYSVLAILAFALVWMGGYYFLSEIKLSPRLSAQIWIFWTIVSVGHALNFWATLYPCALTGLGDQTLPAIAEGIIRFLTIGVNVLALMIGGGLLTLALIWCISGLAVRFSCHRFLKKRHAIICMRPASWNFALMKPMLRPAWQKWLIGIGAFMVLKTDQYFIAWFQGASEIPSYQAAYALVSNSFAGAAMFGAFAAPFISQAYRAGDFAAVQRMTIMNVRRALIVMISAGALLATMGGELIALWLGKANFVGYPVLWVLCASFILDCQTIILGQACQATDDVAFAPSAMAAGILNLILTYFLVRSYGLLGIVLGTAIAQFLATHWYVLVRSLKRIKIPLLDYLKKTMGPLGIYLIVCLILGGMIRNLPTGDIIKIVLSVMLFSLLCSLMLLMFGLDKNQRQSAVKLLWQVQPWKIK